MNRANTCTRSVWILGALAYAYFVVFPGDFKAVLAPVAELLRLSEAASPWLLAVAGLGVLSWTAVRIWAPPK